VNGVGLLYVGAVLLVNGLMLLGHVPPRSAAVLNLFVGALQCVIPTAMLLQANGDAATVLSASGLYLFGFTYLYVGINNLAGLEPQGLGWFCLFVSVAAVTYAALSFGSHDPVFGVIWLFWAALWLLFFLVLGLGRDNLSRFTGWSATLLSVPTCCVPAFLLLTGHYQSSIPIAAATAALLVALLVAARFLSSSGTASHFTAQPVYH
jgi:hypothetical protein